ncbi:MAG: phosphomannomutase [Thermodesulfovibrionales bacterium]|nr:phosphomannomutase [Thermodesulfovibrionales bacterium]
MSKSFKNASQCWKEILSDVKSNSHLLSQIEEFARNNTEPTNVVFGTSGWRGEIGSDYTFNNVRIVTLGIINAFKKGNASFMSSMGVKDFEDIKKRGVIVGHDNRFLGKDFAKDVIGLLQNEGIKTWYSGESITPEFSVGVEMLNAACSINLTPSHNPANFAGFKFNPSDGGPAGVEITSVIEEEVNKIMDTKPIIKAPDVKDVDTIDLTELYGKYVSERGTINLKTIRDFIGSGKLFLVIDNVHGASRGKAQRILGESKDIVYLRTEDDYLFGGIAPEPSEKNMEQVDRLLRQDNHEFKLGVIIDPDGDRIRYSDGTMQIPMNYFGAMALHFLYHYKGIKGCVAKSVGTSNFVNAIANALKIPIKETKVGFKNFRPYMLQNSSERAIVAFEESDGISIYNHTLEKDAIIGLLLAIEMIATTKKNLSQYLNELMNTYGAFYPDRSGISVDRALTGKPLLDKLSKIAEQYKVGTRIVLNKNDIYVKDLITVDGTKIILSDDSWFMIRPSGTEPKVRFYIESRTPEGKDALFSLAERITKEAIES